MEGLEWSQLRVILNWIEEAGYELDVIADVDLHNRFGFLFIAPLASRAATLVARLASPAEATLAWCHVARHGE